MTVGQAQRAVSSAEFAEWIAFYIVEGEMSGVIEHEPTPEDQFFKLQAWAAVHNAKLAAKEA